MWFMLESGHSCNIDILACPMEKGSTEMECFVQGMCVGVCMYIFGSEIICFSFISLKIKLALSVYSLHY